MNSTAATSMPAVTWFMTSLMTFTQYQDVINEPNERVKPVDFCNIKNEYDFIIIGGGTSGSVLASRLSEEASWNVLILESGVDETPVSDVPLFAENLVKSSIDYAYQTEPSCKACLAMNNKRCAWPSGKSLGGSSVVGFMQYLRGNKKDYDNWQQAGNQGWCYDEVLPYFIKSEDNDNTEFLKTCYHGSGGLLSISDPLAVTYLADAFVEAGKEMGYNIVDSNGEKQEGFSIVQGMMREGKRCSAAKAFLRPARNRKNLHIATNSTILKINIDSCSKQAVSVSFLKDGKPLTVKASKEIILAAGAINSPQILMLSGVGPSDHLKSLKIKVIKDLPVGQNLQDHVSYGGLIFKINETLPTSNSMILKDRNFICYAKCGSCSPLSIKKGAEATAFISTCKNDNDFPDIQLIFSPGSLLTDNGATKNAHNLRDDFFKCVYGPNINEDAYTVYPILLRPKSRGSLTLKSRNPSDRPLLNPNYFGDPRDVKVLREGIKFVLKLAKTKALKTYESTIHNVPFPECRNQTYLSDAYLDCAIKQYTHTFSNPVGTCKMGPECECTSVVDPTLRVIGISNLRVADSSIMPTIVSGKSDAPSIMIAEKASDLIKDAWKKEPTCKDEHHDEE